MSGDILAVCNPARDPKQLSININATRIPRSRFPIGEAFRRLSSFNVEFSLNRCKICRVSIADLLDLRTLNENKNVTFRTVRDQYSLAADNTE